jgi:hypothetical protein
MKFTAISVLIWFALATTAAAQGTSSGKSTSSGPSSKASLAEIRSHLHELQRRNEKLADLMEQYRSLVEQRPQAADEAQLAKWNGALDRLLRRIDEGRAAVVETKQPLDQSVNQQLPTALAKDVANARNEAEAQRAAAEQALAKSKPAKQKPAKQKPASEKPAPTLPDDV